MFMKRIEEKSFHESWYRIDGMDILGYKGK